MLGKSVLQRTPATIPFAQHSHTAWERSTGDLPVAAVGGYDPFMRRADVIARISARREELTKQFGVRSLALFGSVARDEARPDSDVDVLVEFEGPTTFDAHMGLAGIPGGPPRLPR